MTIGAVLTLLQAEFPAVRISKLRFLEDQGLVTPSRSGSGYRMYSQADAERLRFALAAQRDSFLPLRVIKQKLEALDAGLDPELPPRVAARGAGLVTAPRQERLTAGELADLTGVPLTLVDDLAGAGVIRADERGRYPARAATVARIAAELGEHGLTPRHLRAVRQAAERHADTIEQAAAAERASRSPAAAERAAARAADIGELYGQLYAAALRSVVDENRR